ncbi:hypothetical protein NLX83_01685 [Allokutzneria sp. A3M-2-11 16]|uniref:hypothetical protein n=1 Tax=Allokutzneria sp. A3M-2-11 16 TaxID=2962043 RepID=UPI0020B739C8|nr:hypothetical protein [Allokutzneria sp. A3M-2-11 16]MCP3797960.1 hypothetical protein [Allokutzneria sp. A3M-2-11 16]
MNQQEVVNVSGLPREWITLTREAGIAAQLICTGLTALRKANFSQPELYNHAFFGLSIGLERLAKLVILIDDKISPPFQYPTNTEFKHKYGHDLQKLFGEVEARRVKYQSELKWSLPDRDLALTALAVLSDFAKSTRYYNLDVLTGAPNIDSKRDPVEAWYTTVATEVLKRKYSGRQKLKDAAEAEFLEKLIEGKAHVLFTAEDGTHIGSIHDSAIRAKQAKIIQRESTVISACLARHMSEVLFVLHYQQSTSNSSIPPLHEFFSIFFNDERDFRAWKMFSIAR